MLLCQSCSATASMPFLDFSLPVLLYIQPTTSHMTFLEQTSSCCHSALKAAGAPHLPGNSGESAPWLRHASWPGLPSFPRTPASSCVPCCSCTGPLVFLRGVWSTFMSGRPLAVSSASSDLTTLAVCPWPAFHKNESFPHCPVQRSSNLHTSYTLPVS